MKLLRRIIILLILFLGVVSPAHQPAGAQNDGLIAISPAQSEVAIGAQVTLTLTLADGVDVNAFDLEVTYNPDLLTLVNWTYGDFLTNLADVNEEDDPGRFHLVATQLATPAVSGDGVLLEITFQGLGDGVSAITLARAELADSQGNKLFPTVRDGSVAVGNAEANPATATPAYSPTGTLTQFPTVTQTQAPINTAQPTATVDGSYPVVTSTPMPTNIDVSTGYPNAGTPTRMATRTPSTGVQTAGPGVTATSPDRTGEATAEPQETAATPGLTPTSQTGVEEPLPTEAGEMVPTAEESTPTQADLGQEPTFPQEQDEQGSPLGVWLAVGVGLIVLGGGAFVLLRRQRQNKYNEDLL